MFHAETIAKLNDLEMAVFDYVIKEAESVQDLTIRELAQITHVSTTTIVRMTNKLGFKGWAELKYFLKSRGKEPVILGDYFENMTSLDLFWKIISKESFQAKVDEAVRMITTAKIVLFIGMGTSGSLSQYGERYFANMGINSFAITDIFRPIPAEGIDDALAIILSVSGETKQIVEKASAFRQIKTPIIAITNNEGSTLSKIADLNLSYNMINEYATPEKDVKLTTQLPVLAILEILGHRSNYLLKKQITGYI